MFTQGADIKRLLTWHASNISPSCAATCCSSYMSQLASQRQYEMNAWRPHHRRNRQGVADCGTHCLNRHQPGAGAQGCQQPLMNPAHGKDTHAHTHTASRGIFSLEGDLLDLA
eukprot:6333692-Amphidinium_carterae.1